MDFKVQVVTHFLTESFLRILSKYLITSFILTIPSSFKSQKPNTIRFLLNAEAERKL